MRHTRETMSGWNISRSPTHRNRHTSNAVLATFSSPLLLLCVWRENRGVKCRMRTLNESKKAFIRKHAFVYWLAVVADSYWLNPLRPTKYGRCISPISEHISKAFLWSTGSNDWQPSNTTSPLIKTVTCLLSAGSVQSTSIPLKRLMWFPGFWWTWRFRFVLSGASGVVSWELGPLHDSVRAFLRTGRMISR